MYEEYFGFKEKPFNIAPDPDFLYLSRKHQNAISSLDFGLMDDAGLILFTGDIGTGKTTLIHHILRKIGVEFTVAVVFNTNVDADQLLGIILQEFGLNADSNNKAAAIKALTRFLIDLRSRKKRPLLIIDEAQSLSLDALEEIRLLSNLQDGSTMLLQIMLVGQPELKDRLKSPSMASLTQRIAVNYHLKPFEREETAQYIAHRLKTARGRTGPFHGCSDRQNSPDDTRHPAFHKHFVPCSAGVWVCRRSVHNRRSGPGRNHGRYTGFRHWG